MNENYEGIVLDEINRLLPIIKLKELYRYKSALVHYRYDFTPRVECTVAELAWGFIRDPCYANQVTEKLMEILPDIRDEPPVFVTEWNNIVTTVTTSLKGPSVVTSEAVMDTEEEVVEVDVFDNGQPPLIEYITINDSDLPPLEEVIDYSDGPMNEHNTHVFPKFDIENQITEQMWIGEHPESTEKNDIDLSNLYALFEEFRSNRNKQDQEIDEANEKLLKSIAILRETADKTEQAEADKLRKRENTITVRVFTEYDLKKNGGMDLAVSSVLPRNQTLSVNVDSTWGETVLFEVEKILGRTLDNNGVYVFVDRVNGTVRPLDIINCYKRMGTYQLLNGEVWVLVSETEEPTTTDEICVHIKWLHKHHFWYQGTKILNRFTPFDKQMIGKPYLYEEITAVIGQTPEVNKLDAKRSPYEFGLGNGDIIVYTKTQEFTVDDVKESIEQMLFNEENKQNMRERFLAELGNQF